MRANQRRFDELKKIPFEKMEDLDKQEFIEILTDEDVKK